MTRPSPKTALRPIWRGKLGRLFAFFTTLFVVLVIAKIANIAFNFTDSMPVGFYHVEPVLRAVRVGDIVETCVPAAAERLAIQRHYTLTGGPCPLGAIYFIKMVAASGGDTVAVTDVSVSVNGLPLPNSATLPTDSRGASLPHVARGIYHLKPGELWLWTPNPRSWDSRYYGIVPAKSVVGFEHLLLAVQAWPYIGVKIVHGAPEARL